MNRQRLDSPLVYIGAHNVYYVKLIMKVLYFTIVKCNNHGNYILRATSNQE